MHEDEYALRPYMDPICLLKWTNFESVWIVTHLSLFCEGIYIRKGFPIVNLDFTLRKWWFVLKHCMISHNYPLDIQIPRTEKTFQSKHVTAKCKILSVPCRKLTANISHLYPTWTPKHHRLKSVFRKGDMNLLDSQEGTPYVSPKNARQIGVLAEHHHRCRVLWIGTKS